MSTAKFNIWQNTDGTENYKCRAWVSFDPFNSTISDSGNISSISDTGTGTWTVNFSSALPNADYAVFGQTPTGTGASGQYMHLSDGGTKSTTAVDMISKTTSTGSWSLYDGSSTTDSQIIVFGGDA